MKLYDGGLTIAIILFGLVLYAAGVTNWFYHCEPGVLEPKGCPKQEQQAK